MGYCPYICIRCGNVEDNGWENDKYCCGDKKYKAYTDDFGYYVSEGICDSCVGGPGETHINNIIIFRNNVEFHRGTKQLTDFKTFLEDFMEYKFRETYSSNHELDVEYQTNYIRKQYIRLRSRLLIEKCIYQTVKS